ncbi:hypothetical protein MIDIC_460004 [Alphaproteobacteria bacterium]
MKDGAVDRTDVEEEADGSVIKNIGRSFLCYFLLSHLLGLSVALNWLGG